MSEQNYLDLMGNLLTNGERRIDRTGVGTRSLFGERLIFELQAGFPLLTTKKINFKNIVVELLWFLRGETNTRYLKAHGVNIWDEWTDENGDLGPVYGAMWRNWPTENGGIDQIANVIRSLQENPSSRRHIVSAWNPAEVDNMALPPCHCFVQFYVRKNKFLDCMLYQRSGDIFLGVPYNIASYALLTHLIAEKTGLRAGRLIHNFGDVHLYENHVEQAKLQLSRTPRVVPELASLPESNTPFDRMMVEDFSLSGYDPYPFIKAPVAV